MWVVHMILESKCSSFEGTASTATDSAAAGEACGTFEVAGLPFIACVGVSRVHARPLKLNVRTVAGDSKVAFLSIVNKAKSPSREYNLPDHDVGALWWL